MVASKGTIPLVVVHNKVTILLNNSNMAVSPMVNPVHTTRNNNRSWFSRDQEVEQEVPVPLVAWLALLRVCAVAAQKKCV